jgi:hypothetical protein
MNMSASRKSRIANGNRRFSLETLEDRRMMAVVSGLAALSGVNNLTPAYTSTTPLGALRPVPPFAPVPALDSLPGARTTIFLDFDGHNQDVWTRTDQDPDQIYRNIQAQAFNISQAEIRRIWNAVAEDFAPFNVNVSTVEPPMTNNVLRVVISGGVTAQLETPDNNDSDTLPQLVTFSGKNFILDPTKTGLMQTIFTGYASENSFFNGQPNVVYVFGQMLQSRLGKSGEGHTLNLAAIVANTVSHEAGHSFGLVHHTGLDANGKPSVYDVGTNKMTPIMGEGLVGDRTLWSTYKLDSSDATSFDSMAFLTNRLGPRQDDHPNSAWSAKPLSFSPNGFLTYSARTYGVIENTADQDWFEFSTSGGDVSINLRTVEFANLDAKLELYKVISTPGGPMAARVATVDPLTTSLMGPFSGLGASYNANLAPGDYMIKVSSHGSYGDVGNYTLTVTDSLSAALISPASNRGISRETVSKLAFATGGAGSASMSTGSVVPPDSSVKRIAAADLLFGALGAPAAGQGVTVKPMTTNTKSFEASVWENFDGILRPSVSAALLAGMKWAA